MYGAPAQPSYPQQAPGYGAPQVGYGQPQPGYAQPGMAPGMMPAPQPGYPPQGAVQAGYWGKFKQSKKAKAGAGGCCCVVIIVVVIIIVLAVVGKAAQCSTASYLSTDTYDATDLSECEGFYFYSYALQVKLTHSSTRSLKVHYSSTNGSTGNLIEFTTFNGTVAQIKTELGLDSVPNAAVLPTYINMCVFKSEIPTSFYGSQCIVHGFELAAPESALKLVSIHGLSFEKANIPSFDQKRSLIQDATIGGLEYSVNSNYIDMDNVELTWVYNEGTSTSALYTILGNNSNTDTDTRSKSITNFADNIWHFAETGTDNEMLIETTTGSIVVGMGDDAAAKFVNNYFTNIRTSHDDFTALSTSRYGTLPTDGSTPFTVSTADSVDRESFIINPHGAIFSKFYLVGDPIA